MAGHVTVRFRGEGSGTGPLTWGQKGLWQTMVEAGESRSLGGVAPVRPGTTVEQVAARLGYLVGRHQALRTRLRLGPDGSASQDLASAGELRLEVVDAADGADPAEVAEQVRRRYQTVPFDYEREWPVRMAVVRHRGVLTHSVAVYLHLALDAYGMEVLVKDLFAHVRGAPPTPVTAMQPLELARLQATPAAQRQCRASLRHLETLLRTAPPYRFPPPAAPAEEEHDTVRFRSPALALAVPAVAARRGIDSSPVLLGAYAVALARASGITPVLVLLAVSNRFRPRLAESVSPLAQIGPALVEVADASLDEVVARAWFAAMTAYKHAYYDPLERQALLRRLAAEHGPVDLSCFFNDRRGRQLRLDRGERPALDSAPPPEPAEGDLRARIEAARGRSQLRWQHEPGAPRQKAYLDADEVPGAVELTLTVDLRYLPRPAAEALVRDIEAVAVAMALDPAAPSGVRAAAVARP